MYLKSDVAELQHAWDLLDQGDGVAARRAFLSIQSVDQTAGSVPLSIACGLARCALWFGELEEARRILLTAVGQLLPSGTPKSAQNMIRALFRLDVPPLDSVNLAFTLGLVWLLEEEGALLNDLLSLALPVPELRSRPGLYAGLLSLWVLSAALQPDAHPTVGPVTRRELAALQRGLGARDARLPRVALAISGALQSERGALFRLTHVHAELADPSIAGQDGVGTLALLVEEVGMLLEAPIEPVSLYGRGLQQCQLGRWVPRQDEGLALIRASYEAAGIATMGPGIQRRASLYLLLPPQPLSDSRSQKLIQAIECPPCLGPPPTLDRVNTAALARLPGLPMWLISRLTLISHGQSLPLPLTVHLLGLPQLLEGRRRVLPDLDLRWVALLAQLGERPDIGWPAQLGDPAGGDTAAVDWTDVYVAAQNVRSVLEDSGLLARGALALSPFIQTETDVVVLREWLEAGDVWDSLALLERGTWPSLRVDWLEELKTDVLCDLALALVRLSGTALPATERRRAATAANWILGALQVEPEALSDPRLILPASRRVRAQDPTRQTVDVSVQSLLQLRDQDQQQG